MTSALTAEDGAVGKALMRTIERMRPKDAFTTQPLFLGGSRDEACSVLIQRFVVPPFSILDTRAGYWQRRRRQWLALGLRGEDRGQKDLVLPVFKNFTKDFLKTMLAISVFDPVLTEVVYKWFCPPGGGVLDPFAGGPTRGVVAAFLGHEYVGIDVRAEQVEANKKQAADMGLSATWIVGDSFGLSSVAPHGKKFDLVFTCPPYYDLEVYSESNADGSAKQTYAEFLRWYEHIMRQAAHLLNYNCFFVVVVGEIRDKKTGAYRNFVGDTIRILSGLGLAYYNELILVNVVGTASIRAKTQFLSGRKVVKTHQNVLVFYKGDVRSVGKIWGSRAVPS